LPSSLTEVLSSTLVYSTSPPVSVCGTGARALARGFSWQPGINPCVLGRNPPLPITPRSTSQRICLSGLPTGLEALRPRTYPPASPHRSNGPERYRNLNLLSITYASRPRLRPDSPAADQHGCGTLGHSVWGIRTPIALLMPTFALPDAPDLLTRLLHCCLGRSPTTCVKTHIRSFGVWLEPRWIVGATTPSTSELLRTLSRVAASKPTSWLLTRRNYLAHLAKT
jgi:hypothetical protein